MSRSSVCRLGFLCLLLAGVGLSLPGCSKQGEGERCDLAANGHADCDEGLVCTKFGSTERCCPPTGAEIGDARCNETPTSTGGSSSGGASSGGSTSGGSTSGGASSSGGASGGGGAPDSAEGGGGAGGGDAETAGASTGGSGG
jgi:hypothetical protein